MHKESSHWSCSQPLPTGGEGKFSFNIQEAAKGGEKKSVLLSFTVTGAGKYDDGLQLRHTLNPPKPLHLLQSLLLFQINKEDTSKGTKTHYHSKLEKNKSNHGKFTAECWQQPKLGNYVMNFCKISQQSCFSGNTNMLKTGKKWKREESRMIHSALFAWNKWPRLVHWRITQNKSMPSCANREWG